MNSRDYQTLSNNPLQALHSPLQARKAPSTPHLLKETHSHNLRQVVVLNNILPLYRIIILTPKTNITDRHTTLLTELVSLS